MNSGSVREKFGNDFNLNEATFYMGVHHLLAAAIAKRFSGHKTCLDACVGAGMMAVYLARFVDKVIGVDIDSEHLGLAIENSKLASVEDKVEFIEGDVIEVLDTVSGFDSAFLDPDWDKAGDREVHVPELSQMTPPGDTLLKKVLVVTPNVCLRLPKEFDLGKLKDFPPHESEAVYLDNKLKFNCVYFGDLIKMVGNTELRLEN